jgi:hypothetical protein
MSEADEEARAVAYRAQEQRRFAYRLALARRLAGSRSARLALLTHWQPLQQALAEAADAPAVPLDDSES